MSKADEMMMAAHRPDTPKADRKKPPRENRAMVNPVKTLGHPARGRKN